MKLARPLSGRAERHPDSHALQPCLPSAWEGNDPRTQNRESNSRGLYGVRAASFCSGLAPPDAPFGSVLASGRPCSAPSLLLKAGKKCLLTPEFGIDRVAACLVSPRADSLFHPRRAQHERGREKRIPIRFKRIYEETIVFVASTCLL